MADPQGSDPQNEAGQTKRPSSQTIPLNLFGMPFGLVGLTGAWAYAARSGLAPPEVADVPGAIAGLVFLAVLISYLRGMRLQPRKLAADLTHPVLAPFSTLVVLVPLLLAVYLLLPHAHGLAATLVDVLIALIVLLGGWLLGQWIYEPLSLDQVHPGYFLPTTAGALLASAAASACGQTVLAEALFGVGIVSWLIIGPMILLRLLFWPPLPPPLVPTIAIEIAPAPTATLAYLSLNGGRIDSVAAGLGGYALLMVLAQVRLLPSYRGSVSVLDSGLSPSRGLRWPPRASRG